MKDEIKFKILPDGTIKTETDRVSAPNHSNAENFLMNIGKLCGGVIQRILKPGAKTHTHNGTTHSH